MADAQGVCVCARPVAPSGQVSAPCLAQASLLDVIASLRAQIAGTTPILELEVLDPDRGASLYPGESVEHAGVSYIHRPYRVWVDLAERLGLRMRTPAQAPEPLIRLRFERLARGGGGGRSGWGGPDHGSRRRDARLGAISDVTEKYGAVSEFARISKLEDPGFVIDVAEALERVRLPAGARILDLGVNTGDEIALVLALSPRLHDATFVGIDHSASALAVARQRFGPNVTFHEADLNALAALALPRFDLVLSVGTLQSPGIDDREVLRRIVQDHLTPNGAVILGFPNCRYVDGEVEHGTRMKNFRQPELGLLIKDVAFYRKYLQQHHRQVFVTGDNYILVTAVAAQNGAS